MKKSQNAVPAILFLFLGLFLFYVLMMTPSQMEGLFGDDSPTTNVSQGISEEVGLVGGSSGTEIVGTRDFPEFFVAYPSERTLRHHENQFTLSSNIFYSDSKYYDFEKGDNTKGVQIYMNIASLTGGPSLRVLLNGVEVGTVPSAGETTLEIDEAQLNSSNRILVVCQFQGWAFWAGETCNFDEMNIYIENFETKDSNFSRNFDITEKEAYASFVVLNFSIGEKTNDGDIIVSINDVEVYKDNPVEGIYTVEEEMNILQTNKLLVQVETGGIYEVKKMTLGFKMDQIAEKMPIIDFYLDDTNSDIIVRVYVEELVLGPNILNLRMESAGVTYQISPLRAGWNEITINKEHLRLRNSMRLSSNGLVDIDHIEIE